LGVLVGLFLIAHGLVHGLYFVSTDDPKYPMTAAKSWLVTRARVPLPVIRVLVSVLSVIAILGFVLLALSYWNLLVPSEWFTGLALASATTSLLLIAVTWNNQFVIGLAIDVAIIYWALTRG
jgi:hypothetical protein